MNKALWATAAALVLTLSSIGKATAQEARYGTEVCVNASLAEEAKRLFPNATLHVLPDFTIRRMNGWRIVSGIVQPMAGSTPMKRRFNYAGRSYGVNGSASNRPAGGIWGFWKLN